MNITYDATNDIRSFYEMCGESKWTLDHIFRAFQGLCHAVERDGRPETSRLFEAVTVNFQRRVARNPWPLAHGLHDGRDRPSNVASQ